MSIPGKSRALRIAMSAGLALGTMSGASGALAAELTTRAISNDGIFNGVTVSADGRIFAVFPHIDGSRGIFIGEYAGDGHWKPYPDAAWNQWVPGEKTDGAFVSANALRIGPDGALWVVDMGSPKRDGSRVAGGARLVRIDLATNTVTRTYSLDAALPADGNPNDVRFNGRHAYLTDSGHAGLLVVDLDTGEARRVLNDAPAAGAQHDSRFNGAPLMQKGKPARVQADQLEVSPDGKWLYFQPAAGPMSRVTTALVDDPSVPPAKLKAAVSHFADTPATGATAIDASGNLYVSDVDHAQIMKITPDGKSSVIIKDPRLLWIDAMWIDTKGNLWMPDAQLGLTAPYQNGQSKVKFPLTIYSMPIGAKQRL